MNVGSTGWQDLECAAMLAWPAEEEKDYDGWRLRFADGFTKRANSVNGVGASTIDLSTKIAFCEAVYARRGLPPVFRITPFSEPAPLDRILEQRGYSRLDETHVLVQTLSENRAPSDGALDVRLASPADWANVHAVLQDRSSTERAQMIGLIQRMPAGVSPLVGIQGADAVSCCLSVVVGGWLGIFAMAVHEDVKRRGIGTSMLRYALDRGRDDGATRAFLQVQVDNAPAYKLYLKEGFTLAYPYWYRKRMD